MRHQLFTLLLVVCIMSGYGGLDVGRTQSAPSKTRTLPTVETVRRVRLSLVHRPARDANSSDTIDRIGRIFLDRKRHRLLVQVRRYKDESGSTQSLFWVEQGKVRPCTEWAYTFRLYYPTDPELLAADMETGLLYYATSSGIGNGAFLHVVERAGHDTQIGENPGHLICLAPTRQKGRAYWGLNDWYTDVDLGGWVGEFQDGKLLKRYEVHETPYQLLYLASTNTVLMIRTHGWQPLNGKVHAYPQVTEGPGEYASQIDFSNDTRLYVGAIDVDAAGQYLYYADRYGSTLYKIRLQDGEVVATRHLPFLVSTLVVDSDSGVIDLVDWKANSLVTVKLF